jgi:hypothetical protein
MAPPVAAGEAIDTRPTLGEKGLCALNLAEKDSVSATPNPGRGTPDPVAGLAPAISIASIVLWMTGPTHAVEAFIAVLALLHGRYRVSR